jgi:hypothetical protein
MDYVSVAQAYRTARLYLVYMNNTNIQPLIFSLLFSEYNSAKYNKYISYLFFSLSFKSFFNAVCTRQLLRHTCNAYSLNKLEGEWLHQLFETTPPQRSIC